MQKNFVTFFSPGIFVAEQSERPIESWDTEKAMKMARSVKERHGALPYGFQFTTRTRGDGDLDSSASKRSPMYFLGGTVETLAQVKRRATEKDRILVQNMEGNGYTRIITNTNSWKWVQPLNDDDVVLEFEMGATVDAVVTGSRG